MNGHGKGAPDAPFGVCHGKSAPDAPFGTVNVTDDKTAHDTPSTAQPEPQPQPQPPPEPAE